LQCLNRRLLVAFLFASIFRLPTRASIPFSARIRFAFDGCIFHSTDENLKCFLSLPGNAEQDYGSEKANWERSESASWARKESGERSKTQIWELAKARNSIRVEREGDSNEIDEWCTWFNRG
jgi:hypothetical protein